MNKLIPHLWFDKEAREAAEFYTSLFDNSVVLDSYIIEDTPSGDVEAVAFQLEGLEFSSISAGPYFKFNPSVSLMVYCDTSEEVDAKWKALIQGGSALMPLDEYPFSKRYGWLQDRFGLSWQLFLSDQKPANHKIVPSLLFSGDANGKAEEAIHYYAQVFDNASVNFVSHYGEGEAEAKTARVNFAAFQLENLALSAMDHAFDVDFGFNEAFSFMVSCNTQQEIDYFWEKLSADPEAEACGWCKDAYGLSWQIVPADLEERMANGTPEQVKRLTDAFMKMKKFDLATLDQAYAGTGGTEEADDYPDSSSDSNAASSSTTHPRPKITVETMIHKPLAKVWQAFTIPEHIMAWNHASDDWYSPAATNDLRPGGTFCYTMAARDGSFRFDFSGVFDVVDPSGHLSFTLGDGRRVELTFQQQQGGVYVVETFEAEGENSLELQKTGWQSILDNFRKYVEGLD